MSRLTERMHSRVVGKALAAVVAVAMFAGSAALAQDAEDDPSGLDSATASEILQDPPELDARPQPGALGVLDPSAQAIWLEQHRRLEYDDALHRLTPQPYEWAGWLQVHRMIEYPESVGVFLAEVERQ